MTSCSCGCGAQHPDDDGFTEVADAVIPRVDLVGKGANGLPFLIAKSVSSGLVAADDIRTLLKTAEPEPTPRGGTSMPLSNKEKIAIALGAAPAPRERVLSNTEKVAFALGGAASPVRKADANIPVYDMFGQLVGLVAAADLKPLGDLPGRGADPVPGSILADSVAKAKAKALMPVFDATGNLVGLLDKKDLIPVAAPPQSAADKSAATVTANIAADPSHPSNAAAAGQEVAKAARAAVSAVTFSDSGLLVKAVGAGSVGVRWGALLKAAGPGAGQLRTAATYAAVHLSVAAGVPPQNALRIAQDAFIQAAAARPRR